MPDRRGAAPAFAREEMNDRVVGESPADRLQLLQKGQNVRVSRIGLVLSAIVLAMISPAAATAQEGLDVTTAYPAVTVDPGGSAQFPLTITTTVPERVDLALTSVPEGWDARIRGGGSTVAAVFTTATGAEPPEVSVEVDVPLEATPGTYQVVLQGRTATVTHDLTLDMTVEEVEAGAVTLSTQFPSLRGSADSTFRFDLELENGTNQEATFTLETQAPAGWTVDARPTGEEQAATAVVAAGGTTNVEVTAEPPPGVAAQAHPIVVRAVGGPQPAEVELVVEVTGTEAMTFQTADERLNARLTVGSSTTVALEVFNTGTAPLTDLSFSATPPTGWRVEFEPTTLEVAPGTSQSVQATVIAADTAIAGDYAVRMTATAGTLSESVEVRTTVETSPIGGFIGLALLAVVAVALLLVFRRYGRR